MVSQDSGARAGWRTVPLALGALAVAVGGLCAVVLVGATGDGLSVVPGVSYLGGLQPRAQEGEGPDEIDLAPEQIEKYISVYKAMQRDHNLTIDQATARQGLSVEAFRDIESKVERDDPVREHVRQALANDASAGEHADGSAKAPTRHHPRPTAK